ncbi:MAG: hypothetical protein WGN25_03340 [Candidatus Electrothrix sp. GW3-4]|uniref:hypothetical protein n=1 Tax=Candidatus Electrothrix sp. GW3-4 TaxID=3126740 RepID=UPI0030CC6571
MNKNNTEGLNAEGVEQGLFAPWWGEMVTDFIETPAFCEPDESPEQVLEYAKTWFRIMFVNGFR